MVEWHTRAECGFCLLILCFHLPFKKKNSAVFVNVRKGLHIYLTPVLHLSGWGARSLASVFSGVCIHCDAQWLLSAEFGGPYEAWN